MLTPAQIQFYREQGYLGIEDVFSPGEVAELRRVTDEFVEASRAVTANNAVFDLEPSHTPQQPRLRRLKDPIRQHEAYRRALLEGMEAEVPDEYRALKQRYYEELVRQ